MAISGGFFFAASLKASKNQLIYIISKFDQIFLAALYPPASIVARPLLLNLDAAVVETTEYDLVITPSQTVLTSDTPFF